MSRIINIEYRVQEFPLCVNGEEILADSGWVLGDENSVPLDDFGELKDIPSSEQHRMLFFSRHRFGRIREAFIDTRKRVSFPGRSRALLHSFFW
ncbi:MAG: hypothetical protein ACOX6K_07055 [Sphaerochaetaceae bacterium]|jgi:hypothetical protein